MRRSRLAVGGVVALLVTGIAAGRVFLPADTLDRSHLPQPRPATVDADVYGELMSAPLLVDSRLRVYAGDNRIWADGPVDTRLNTSALWAFRRWPATLVGVVVTGHTVVSKWSDGQLVAIDADQRRIAWRAGGPVGATAYQGRRTGARTVYDPPDLYLGTAPDGGTVVVSAGTRDASGFDPASGRQLWHAALPGQPGCRRQFTSPGWFVVFVDGCAGPVTSAQFDLRTGAARTGQLDPRMSPVGCAVGHSRCAGLAGPPAGVLFDPDGSTTPAAGLTGTDLWLSGRTVLRASADGQIAARDAVTGAPVWSWLGDAGAQIIAVEPDQLHVLTADHEMYTLALANGGLRSWFAAQIEGEDDGWKPGYVYAAHGFVAIERLLPDGRPDQPDTAYYYGFPTVMFTGS